MRTLSATFFALNALLFTTALNAQDDVISHHVEEVETPEAAFETLETRANQSHRLGARRNAFAGEESSVSIDQIVNLGRTIFKVIKENQPVVNVKYDFASALPKGASGAADLDGFSDLQYRSYRMWGENLYGFTVYDVTYTLVHQYGGSYNGKGQYLETVTILPTNVDVMWGYTVNMNVAKVTALNVGTKRAPIASISMLMAFEVKTIIKHHRTNVLYQFRGDSPRVVATNE